VREGIQDIVYVSAASKSEGEKNQYNNGSFPAREFVRIVEAEISDVRV